MADHLMVITTVGNESDARKVAKNLVGRRLVACVNVSAPVRSFYQWKGSLEDETEHMLFMKTRAELFQDLEQALGEIHPYDVPELIAVPIEKGSAAYLGWVDENVQQASDAEKE
jgi:periplasmic divalent cation tolerance protein